MREKLQAVDDLMVWGQQQGVFPGAVLLIAYRGQPILLEAYGWANLFTRTPAHTETIFDLASLTKVLATTLAVMELVSSRRLALDTCLADVLQEPVPPDKAAITIAQLLDHTAGLPDYRPYYLDLANISPNRRKILLWHRLLAEPLTAVPGSRVCYSDLGFMLLQQVIETIHGRSLGDVAAELYRQLQVRPLFFATPRVVQDLYDVAATEICPWRRRLVWGSVHDENAWMLQGVAGHAGLFGTAGAVYRLLDLLRQSREADAAAGLLAPEVVRHFFMRRTAPGRALGFDCPSATNSSSGRYFNPSSVGHLGFTGTSFWMDWERNLLVILLTNRVHPSRRNITIRAFRPRLHDQVLLSLGLM